jgi:predicted acyl esterase
MRYREFADALTPHGFVVAVQDVRGRYTSDGTGEFEHSASALEGEDGADSIEWIAQRAWSNGFVGMFGSSFAGMTQARAAIEAPSALGAIWVDVGFMNSHAGLAREGGAMALQTLWHLLIETQDAKEVADRPECQSDVWEDLRALRGILESPPWYAGQLSLRHAPALETLFLNYYTRGSYDAWWHSKAHNYLAHLDNHPDIPSTFSSGWFDPALTGMIEYFQLRHTRSEKYHRLIIGPWNHVGMRSDSTYVYDVDFGASSAWGLNRYTSEHLKFFEASAFRDVSREGGVVVNVFVMGGGTGRRTAEGRMDHGGEWRTYDGWPPREARDEIWHLTPDGGLDRRSPSVEHSSLDYVYDPAHPVPTIGGSLCAISELPQDVPAMPGDMWSRHSNPILRLRRLVIAGPTHQKEDPSIYGASPPYPLLSDRADVLSFASDELETPIEMIGRASVTLWISSTAPDTDFTAKILDIYPFSEDYPEGYHMNLCDSIIRCRFRDDVAGESNLVCGEIYRIRIVLPPTANRFEIGHRIRLDVSSSNFPRLDLNPNTGEPIGRHTRLDSALQTVHMGADYPSHVAFPIVGNMVLAHPTSV